MAEERDVHEEWAAIGGQAAELDGPTAELAGAAAELDGPELRTSDPAVLRALAHPLRVEMLAVIDELGEATATRIAERVGESPSNCSFHLRQLAKAGFIERADAKGTSKPWKPVHQSRDLRPEPGNPESMRTSASIGAMYVQHEANRMVEFLTRHGLGDDRWLPGIMVNTSAFWATPEELAEVAEEIAHLADRFRGRKDPANRPPGSRKAHLFATLNPDLDLPATPAADEAAAAERGAQPDAG